MKCQLKSFILILTVLLTMSFNLYGSSSRTIDLKKFSKNFSTLNTLPQQGINIAQSLIEGKNSNLEEKNINDKYYIWTEGNLHDNNIKKIKGGFYSIGLGLGYIYNKNIRYSLHTGYVGGNNKLFYGGDSFIDGYYIGANTNIKLPTKIPLYTTFSYLYGKNDLDIKSKAYRETISLGAKSLTNIYPFAYGKSNQKIQAFKVKLQWHAIKNLLLPYVQYNYTNVKTYGYKNKEFSVKVDDNSNSVTDFKYGINSNFQLNETNKVITTLEGVHRVTSEANKINAQVAGIKINSDKYEYKKDWARVAVALESTFDIGKITFTLSGSTSSDKPQYYGGINYEISF